MKRGGIDKDEENSKRAKKAEYQRNYRARMNAEKQLQQRVSDTNRKRESRAMASDQKRASDAQRKRESRENASDEQRASEAQRKRESRAKASDEQRASEAQRKQNFRSNLPQRERDRDIQRRSESRLQNARSRGTRLQEIANRCYSDEGLVTQHFCGLLNEECYECRAKHYEVEKYTTKKIEESDGSVTVAKLYTKCCQKGKVKLPHDERRYPELLESLLKKNHQFSQNFMENIRAVNSSFAFASMGAKMKPPPGHGPYCFRIHGNVFHRTGTLHPAPNEERQYGQLFIIDASEANAQREAHSANRSVHPQLIQDIDALLRDINPFAHIYRMMYEVEEQSKQDAINNGHEIPEIKMAITTDRNKDPRRYNVQVSNEVGIVFSTSDGLPPVERDLIIHSRVSTNDPARGLQRLSIINPNVDPMTYPIFFPFGEQGWGIDIQRHGAGTRSKVTCREYLCHKLSDREGVFNPLLSGGKLFQEYCVISYVKVESGRLEYIKNNQGNFRVDSANGLRDFIAGDEDASRPGQAYVLPSSFPGGPRYMQQNYQDAMAIVTKYGKPDLFITMTCNPKWPEIQDNLETWQSAEHRPDLIATVFELKLTQLLEDITKPDGGIFGRVLAYVWVIEFQKRGLPHAHMLLILENKLDTPEKIDQVVKAEIPTCTDSPRLFNIVTSNMVHRKCGKGTNKPCMKGDICTKGFPKQFQEETSAADDGFAKYKRRKSQPIQIGNTYIDNSWIVPYNPYLLLKYNCHINVEVCASIKSVKYLYKYIFKGHDCADVKITEKNRQNEIETYVDCRYVSAPESVWRIFGYTMHAQSHSVDRLTLHLPGEQRIFFTEAGRDAPNEEARRHLANQLQEQESKHTMLTGYFELNRVCASARNLYYYEIPTQFVWIQKDRRWDVRKRYFNKIGRMYSISPKAGGVFYLRLLLLHVKGATGFDDLRTFNQQTYLTFKDAAKARGLLLDDDVWRATIQDAVVSSMACQLRSVFAFICIFGDVANPLSIWSEFLFHFMDDYCHKIHQNNEVCQRCDEYAIRDVRAIFYSHGVDPDKFGLPKPTSYLPTIPDSFDIAEEHKKAESMKASLNDEQRTAFEAIVSATEDRNVQAKCFFLDGPGGSGKTYLYETLTHYFRAKHKTVLSAATTGIAANLLIDGRTLHSLFKLQLSNNENLKANLTEKHEMWRTIQRADLIIVDECTMASCHQVNAVDNLLRSIMELVGGQNVPFGGKVIVFGGDFRQCLAIVPHAPRAAIVQGSLRSSKSWQYFQRFKLSNNMRCIDKQYSDWLLEVGNGTLECEEFNASDSDDMIEIPERMLTDNIIHDVFGDSITMENVRDMSRKAILCPKNRDVDKLNGDILKLIHSDEMLYLSSDSVAHEDFHVDYTTEFLNSLTLSGMPPHKLILKIGCVVMLLRNLNTKEGLCNGTRFVVTALRANIIEAEVLTGTAKGSKVMLPRIDITNDELGFTIKRRQFPIKLSFAMTINKSQGQTLDKVGVFLKEPVFGHGQLYVALSRVRKEEDIKIQVLSTPVQGKLINNCNKVFTRNVVYKEVLQE